MSKLTFLHKVNETKIVDGKKVTHEEQITDGLTKGVMIKFYHKENDHVEKYTIAKKDDKYKFLLTVGDKKDEKLLSKDELLKEISKIKSLKFAVDYLKSAKTVKRVTGGNKSSVKKSSAKKSSVKKGSVRKSSVRKGSKKGTTKKK